MATGTTMGGSKPSPIRLSPAPPSEGACVLLSELQVALGDLKSEYGNLADSINFILSPYPENANNEMPVRGNSQIEMELSKALNTVYNLQRNIVELRNSIRL